MGSEGLDLHGEVGEIKEVWTQVALKELLSRIKKSIPAREADRVYFRTQRALDWEQIAFSTYSPEQCRAKWKQMFDKMRKVRTMTELVEEAESVIDDPFKPKKYQIHPELPSRPPLAHSLYWKENKDVFKKKYPNLAHSKVMALANAGYKELPAQAKAEYVKKYKVLREQYEQDLIHHRQQYGVALQKKRGLYSALKRKMDEVDVATSSQPGKKRKDVLPDRPPQNGFMLFKEEQRCTATDSMPVKGQLKTCSKLWRKKTLAERDDYSVRTKQLRREYGVKLKTFLSSMTQEKKELLKEDLQMLYKSAEKCSKVPQLMFPGEPKKPSWSGATVFCSEKIKQLASNVKSRDRFKLIASMWASLSATERAPFSRKAKKKFERYTLDLHDWFSRLSAGDQAEYLKRKPQHAKYVIVVRNLENPMKVEPYGASDSEDEDYLDLDRNDDPEGDNEEEDEEEEGCEDLGDEGVFWTHEKFTKPACRTGEITEDSSDYDED